MIQIQMEFVDAAAPAIETHESAEATAYGIQLRDKRVLNVIPWHRLSRVTIIEVDDKGEPTPEPRQPTFVAAEPIPGERRR